MVSMLWHLGQLACRPAAEAGALSLAPQVQTTVTFSIVPSTIWHHQNKM
jgi:hypothetical protein